MGVAWVCPQPAITAYSHSLRLQKNNAVVHANRAMCHLKLKAYRAALADCTAAIQLDDAYTKAYLRRGIAHRRLSQVWQALTRSRTLASCTAAASRRRGIGRSAWRLP